MIADQERAPAPPAGASSHRMEVEIAVYRAGPIYRAVCLDFGLIVERQSEEDALEELYALVRDHVKDGLAEGKSPQQLLRPVPASERAYVYRRLVVSALNQWAKTRLNRLRRGGSPPREGFALRRCLV